MHEDITVGTHVNRPTVIHPGLEHEEILYRFLTVLRRFSLPVVPILRPKMRSYCYQTTIA